jgi:hypothetical protein
MEQAPHRLRIAVDRAHADRATSTALMIMSEAFDVPGIPEIAKAAEAQRRARLALIAGDRATARDLSAQARRFSQLARVRIQSRRERSAP